MNDLNLCNFIGRLGKDVDLRYSADGKPIANFSIACGESWKNKSTGQKQEKTTWVRIVIFGNLAEIAGKYLSKGSQVYISGKLQERKWQDKTTGMDRFTTEIVIDNFVGSMQMLGGGESKPNQINNNPDNFESKSRPQQDYQPGSQKRPPPPNQPQGAFQQPTGEFIDDQEIPFN